MTSSAAIEGIHLPKEELEILLDEAKPKSIELPGSPPVYIGIEV